MPAVLRQQRCALTAPFHPYPGAKRASSLRAAELSRESPGSRGGIFSVALAVHVIQESPLETHVPDVIRHTALRSSDFPPPISPRGDTGSDRPAPLLPLVYRDSGFPGRLDPPDGQIPKGPALSRSELTLPPHVPAARPDDWSYAERKSLPPAPQSPATARRTRSSKPQRATSRRYPRTVWW